jgi:hypothetical protein
MRIKCKPLSGSVSGENVGGKDAAVERTWMYSQRFPEEISRDSDAQEYS